jgi:enolase
LYEGLIDAYPIVSIEDGFGEDDGDGFRAQTTRCGDRLQIVGDDLYMTNARFIRRGIVLRSGRATPP